MRFTHQLSTGRPHTISRPAGMREQRGSVLMVALILAGVIAIALTSFLQLTGHASKMAVRSFYMDGAQNLCDLGLEHSLWSMNNSVWGGAGFTQSATSQYQATFPTATTSYTLSNGVGGQVKVWADLTTASRPHVVVKAIVTLVDGSQIVKMSEGYMKAGSYFDDGLVGYTLNLNGNVDSWNSVGAGGVYSPYDPTHANANAKIAATSTAVGADNVGQANMMGYAAAGSTDSGGGITVGSQGAIGDANYVNTHNGTIQDGHATYDFTASFPDAAMPTVPATAWGGGVYSVNTVDLSSVSNTVTIPSGSDQRASDGVYYYTTSQIGISGNSSNVLQIAAGAKVVFMIPTMSSAVSVGGNCGGIVIPTNSSVKIYTPGSISINGNGLTNGTSAQGSTDYNHMGQPIDFQVYGTRTAAQMASSGTQSVSVGGNGYFSGVIYAPNADVHINGNGDVFGAAIGNSVRFSGSNVKFHVDESLAATITNGTWKLRKWRELATPTEQALYASNVSF